MAAFKRRAIIVPINLIHKLHLCILSNFLVLMLVGWFVLLLEFGATVLGLTFETAAVLLSCHCQAKFIWVQHGRSKKFGTDLSKGWGPAVKGSQWRKQFRSLHCALYSRCVSVIAISLCHHPNIQCIFIVMYLIEGKKNHSVNTCKLYKIYESLWWWSLKV